MSHRSMAYGTLEAQNLVRQLDRSGAVTGSPPHTKWKRLPQTCSARLNSNATSRDQSAPIASRKFFPPCAARVAPHALGWLLGSFESRAMVCVPRNGSVVVSMIKEGCRLGCREQPYCLRRYNQCPRMADILANFWRPAGV